jgi:glycerol-3-phosphate dehydrogenase
MERNLASLADNRFDLLIVGGGIHGVALAWFASLAGYRTALIDRRDFGGETSANSQKIIHGGLRYLQRLDFGRVRSSVRERQRLMWLAPHLVHPQRSVLPISGHGSKGREAVWAGLGLYNMLTSSLLPLDDPTKKIPAARILAKDDLAALIPEMRTSSYLGAAEWHDATCWNTERLVLAFARGAAIQGATVANYVGALNLLEEAGSVQGVEARDELDGTAFDIRAATTVDCTGPWFGRWWTREESAAKPGAGSYVSGINLVTERIFEQDVTVSLRTMDESPGGVLVVSPWGTSSIVGTHWMPFAQEVSEGRISKERCESLWRQLESAAPGLDLTSTHVRLIHHGLVPAGGPVGGESGRNWLTQPEIRSHEAEGHGNLFSVRGVKLTTAAAVAESVLKEVFPGYQARPLEDLPRLPGGDVEDWRDFVDRGSRYWKEKELKGDPGSLLQDYGSEIGAVLALSPDSPAEAAAGSGGTKQNGVLAGRVLFAVRHEMAKTLSDVVLRRTGIGASGFPGIKTLRSVATLMAGELSWSTGRMEEEIRDVEDFYPSFLRVAS